MITRIYAKDYVVLDYDPSVPCVVASYSKFMLMDEFKEHLEFALEFMKEKAQETGRIMWLPDVTLYPVFAPDQAKWAIEDWTPRALAANIRYVAFVLPGNEWTMGGIEDYNDGGVAKGMTTANFKDVESAKKWFRELQQK
jgi:hypothetical protein